FSSKARANPSRSSGLETSEALAAQYRSSRRSGRSATAARQKVTIRPVPTGRPRPRRSRPNPISPSRPPRASGSGVGVADHLGEPRLGQLLILVILQHRTQRLPCGALVQALDAEEGKRVGAVDPPL